MIRYFGICLLTVNEARGINRGYGAAATNRRMINQQISYNMGWNTFLLVYEDSGLTKVQ